MRAMIPTLILIQAISLPAAAAGADGNAPPPGSQPAVGAEGSSGVAQQPSPPAPQRPAPPAPPRVPLASERPRRASLVGYIEDATLNSQVRVRFDAGFQNSRPDRAEFFYAQCGCNGGGAPGPAGLATDLNFQQLTVNAQYGVHDRVAVFAVLPVRFIQPQRFFRPSVAGSFADQSGLADLQAGVKAAIVSTDETLLTAQLQASFQSGDATKGLGTAHTSLEPAILFHQKLANRVALESQLGDWHPIGGSAFKGVPYTDDVLFYGIGPSFEVYRSEQVRLAPVVELVGWHLFGGQQVQPPGVVVPADTNIVNLKAGVRTIVDDRHSLYVGFGWALTDASWYNEILRVEYRYSF